MAYRNIEVNLWQQQIEIIRVQQWEVAGRTIAFRILAELSRRENLTGKNVRLYTEKSDGAVSFVDCAITNAEQGECEVVVSSQMAAVAGVSRSWLLISDGSMATRSPMIQIIVEASPDIDGAVQSKDEMTALLEILALTFQFPDLYDAAQAAAQSANDAAGNANTAAGSANQAAQNANEATGRADTATANANNAAGLANTAAQNADISTGNANAAAEEARQSVRVTVIDSVESQSVEDALAAKVGYFLWQNRLSDVDRISATEQNVNFINQNITASVNGNARRITAFRWFSAAEYQNGCFVWDLSQYGILPEYPAFLATPNDQAYTAFITRTIRNGNTVEIYFSEFPGNVIIALQFTSILE